MKKEIKLQISGFTLMELMVTLSIAAILLTLAVPGFQSLIQNSRMTSQSNALLTAFHIARSEAIKRVVNTTVCSSTDGATCSGGTDWSSGWIVIDNLANPLKTWAALSGDAVLTSSTTVTVDDILVTTVGDTSVVFTSAGTATTTPCFSLTLPGSTESRRRYIAISATGHPSSKTACP